jgi:hypothetical protein
VFHRTTSSGKFFSCLSPSTGRLLGTSSVIVFFLYVSLQFKSAHCSYCLQPRMDIDELASRRRKTQRLLFSTLITSNMSWILSFIQVSLRLLGPCTYERAIYGAYNYCVSISGTDTGRVIIRFPFPSECCDGDERFESEIAAMQYVSEFCPELRIPKIFSHGKFSDGPLIGHSYLIMEELSGKSLCAVWTDIKDNDEVRKKIFSQIANVVLCLSRVHFKEIGSLPLGTREHKVCINF